MNHRRNEAMIRRCRRLGPALILLGLSLALQFHCRGETADRPPEPAPLLLVGLDGASPEVVALLAERGELPTLARLITEGYAARFETYIPTTSPLIWNSMATGMAWPRLGIHLEDMKRGFRGSTLEPAPFWRIASRAGKRVALLNWWLSWPAEEVTGRILTDRAPYFLLKPPVERRREGLTHPENWLAELVKLRRRKASVEEILEAYGLDQTMHEMVAQTNGLAEVQGHLVQDQIVVEALKQVLAAETPDVAAFIVRGVDVTQHEFWPDPKGPEGAADDPVIAGLYRFYDRLLGELIEDYHARIPGGRVIVVSDHGMRPMGELLLNEARVDLAPRELLPLLGLSRITVEGIPFTVRAVEQHSYAEEVFFLLDPPGESAAAAAGVDTALKEKAVSQLLKVLGGARTASGKPLFVKLWPETVLEWCDVQCRVNTALTRNDSLSREDGLMPLSAMGFGGILAESTLAGQHYLAPDGTFIAWGPGIRRGGSLTGAERVAAEDIAPTLLSLLGLPPAQDMDGSTFTAMFDRPSGPDWAPELVDSYGHLQAVIPGGELEDSSGLDQKRLEEFRALGYVQ